jgi:hypothetical protein
MKIEAQPTTSTSAEAVQAKAEARLLLAENGLLRAALVSARQCIDAGEVIQAYGEIVAALQGEKQ